jgi:hypothetical protein
MRNVSGDNSVVLKLHGKLQNMQLHEKNKTTTTKKTKTKTTTKKKQHKFN